MIENSIYQAAAESAVPDNALLEYIRIMGFSVDFQREVQPGDAFEMLYERKIDLISGEEIGTKLHYAGLRLSGTNSVFTGSRRTVRAPAGLTRTEIPPLEH